MTECRQPHGASREVGSGFLDSRPQSPSLAPSSLRPGSPDPPPIPSKPGIQAPQAPSPSNPGAWTQRLAAPRGLSTLLPGLQRRVGVHSGRTGDCAPLPPAEGQTPSPEFEDLNRTPFPIGCWGDRPRWAKVLPAQETPSPLGLRSAGQATGMGQSTLVTYSPAGCRDRPRGQGTPEKCPTPTLSPCPPGPLVARGFS